eukprot:4501594-Pyramimonas_sp.AAC.1
MMSGTLCVWTTFVSKLSWDMGSALLAMELGECPHTREGWTLASYRGSTYVFPARVPFTLLFVVCNTVQGEFGARPRQC